MYPIGSVASGVETPAPQSPLEREVPPEGATLAENIPIELVGSLLGTNKRYGPLVDRFFPGKVAEVLF